MDYIIYKQVTPKSKYLDELLFIIRSKGGINKSQIIKVISQAYDIIGKINSIFITTLIRVIFNNINRGILYITLRINTKNTKKIVNN